MTGHPTRETMRRFRQNHLPAEELLALDEHLQVCEQCRRVAVSLEHNVLEMVASALTGVRSSTHLTYEELEGLADGSLSPAAVDRVGSHVAACSECRADAENFRALARTDELVADATPGFFHRLSALVSTRLVTIGAAVILLISVGLVIWLSSGRGRNEVVLNSVVGNTTNGSDQVLVDSQVPFNNDKQIPELPDNTEEESALALSLDDGGRLIGLDRAGNLAGLDNVSQKYRLLLRDSLRNQRLPAADLSDLRSPPSATMGGTDGQKETFTVVGPIGRVVDTTTPTLRWQPLSESEGYIVDVYDQNYNEVATSGRLTRAYWAPRLHRGQTYIWQVTAFKKGQEIRAPQRPKPEARFRILDAVRASELASLRRDKNKSPLLLALAYSEAGLFDKAETEMEKVAAANPRSELVRKFLDQLRARRTGR